MYELNHPWLNSCLVIAVVMVFFVCILFILGAWVFMFSSQIGGI